MERLSMEEIKVLKDTIGFRIDKIKADGSFEAKRNIFCVVKEDIQDTPLNRVNRDLMEKAHYLAKIGFLESEPFQKIGREELDCYHLSEDGKDFLEEVFECRIDLRKEINELSLLVEEDEEIVSYVTSHLSFLYYLIREKDSTDIAAALENTLHRILENGGNPDIVRYIMGAYVPTDEEWNDIEEHIDIDLGYVLPGQMLYINHVEI